MERYCVNRRSKRSKNNSGVLSRWRNKYVGGLLLRTPWTSSGYNLDTVSTYLLIITITVYEAKKSYVRIGEYKV